jgi:hypothetical protein
MERWNDGAPEPLVELGIASIATKGPLGNAIEAMGLWHKTGIADA